MRKIGVGALRMADGDGDAMSAAEETAKRLKEQAAALRESAAESEAEIRPASNKDKADEVTETPVPAVRPEDMPPKQKISDDMQKRLRQELISQGADPNRSAGNPILVVAGIIAVLVIVGGQGIFY
ncbi:unnamed protein product [Ectocarpus fasciculatus]